MAKTATFGVMHLGIAFLISYALTGSWAIAGAITFVEPLANTVAHYFFDKYWDNPRWVSWRARWAPKPTATAMPSPVRAEGVPG